MLSKSKILLLLPYFGKTPEWIDYFMESCRMNPKIEWLVFSNMTIKAGIPANMHFISATLEDFNILASQKLGINVKLYNPYKICDYRPAFAVIFSEYIASYDYWGYCDLDMIFGDINSFLIQNNYTSYDIITTRKDSLAGHFTIFRNRELINYMYKKIWRYNSNLLTINKHFYLDERSNYIGQAYQKGSGKLSCKNILKKIRNSLLYRTLKVLPLEYDITRVAHKLEKKGSTRIRRILEIQSDENFRKKQIHNWKIIWEDGTLTDRYHNQELLYFHFIQLKKSKDFVPDPFRKTSSFVITRKGIRC